VQRKCCRMQGRKIKGQHVSGDSGPTEVRKDGSETNRKLVVTRMSKTLQGGRTQASGEGKFRDKESATCLKMDVEEGTLRSGPGVLSFQTSTSTLSRRTNANGAWK